MPTLSPGSPPGTPERDELHEAHREQLRRIWQYQIIGNPHTHDNPIMSPHPDGVWHSVTKPLSTSRLREIIGSRGFDADEAATLADIVQEKLRELHSHTGQPVSMQQLVHGIKNLAMAETERQDSMALDDRANDGDWEGNNDVFEDILGIPLDFNFPSLPYKAWVPPLEKLGVDIRDYHTGGSTLKKFTFKDWVLEAHWDGRDPYAKDIQHPKPEDLHKGSDVLTALCQCTELAIELGKHLRVEDIVTLFSVSQTFYYSISNHLLASVKTWIAYKAPEAGRIFPYQLYKRHLVQDPTGRTWRDVEDPTAEASAEARDSRKIPGLKYLQMVVTRDKCCREMIAIMARNGHLMPKTMHGTLLRLWLLMDISTSRQRLAFLQNEKIWTDHDLYNAQFFFVKLCLHFNDPIYGPSTHDLLHLMMGQKGLFTLWQLLMRKRFTKLAEIVKLKTRYDLRMPSCGRSLKRVHGVPLHLVGVGHNEGWGLGTHHLQRPDELIPLEAVRRGLELDKHLMHMVIWGYFDWKTGENIVPTQDDMYISDDEEALAHMDTTRHWKPKHALKKRFAELTSEQQQAIIDEDEDDRLRAMAWCGDDIDDYESDGEETPYSLDDELNRGYIVPPVPKDAPTVPTLYDQPGWNAFVNDIMLELPPEMDEDEALRAQAWQSYQHAEASGSWDWERWLNDRASSRPSSSGNILQRIALNTIEELEDML